MNGVVFDELGRDGGDLGDDAEGGYRAVLTTGHHEGLRVRGPPAGEDGRFVSSEVSLDDGEHCLAVVGASPLDGVLLPRWRLEGVADDRVLDEVEQVGGRRPSRAGLELAQRHRGDPSPHASGQRGIAQLDARGGHVAHHRAQLEPVHRHCRDREIPERAPRRVDPELVAQADGVDGGSQQRFGDPTQDRCGLDRPPIGRVQVVEEHLDELLDDLGRRTAVQAQVGVPNERFGRQLQRQRVAPGEGQHGVGQRHGHRPAGQQRGGVGVGERPHDQLTDQAPPTRRRAPGRVGGIAADDHRGQ